MHGFFEYPRLGWGPFGEWQIWPLWPLKKLFYEPRPDLHKSKTRAPQWALLQTESRFLQALFCWIGPPSHILWNIKVGHECCTLFRAMHISSSTSCACVIMYDVSHAYRSMIADSSSTTPSFFHHDAKPPPPIILQLAWLTIMSFTLLIWGWHQGMEGAEALRHFDSANMIGSCFTLSSFVMSLLLSFRLTQTYYRWRDARAAVAGHAQGTLSVYMQAATWIKDPTIVEAFRRWCLVW